MVSLDALRATVLTEEAEETCDLLMIAAAEHERFSVTASAWSGNATSGHRFALSYVMQCVVLVEVFTFGRTLRLSDVHAGSIVSPVFDQLYKAHRKQVENSWEQALKSLELWPGAEPKLYADYQALRGFIIARNSWAHGHGRLTNRQVAEMKTTTNRLEDAGLAVVGNYVLVRPDQVRDVARSCRSFVQTLDRETSPHL